MKKYEFDVWTVRWIRPCTQKFQSTAKYTNGRWNNQWCPLSFILGPVLLTPFIKDTDRGIKCTIRKCVVVTKMSIVLDIPEGRDAVQKDFERLEKWTSGNLKKINRA